VLKNCTFHGNYADDKGGGALCFGAASSPLITNSIFWANAAGYGGHEIALLDALSPSTLAVEYSDIKGGATGVYIEDGCTLNWGYGNLTANPLFAGGPGGEFYLSQIAAGQPADSPCLEAGREPAADTCFPAPGGSLCLHQLTTRTDQITDFGIVNLGRHYNLLVIPTPSPGPSHTPGPYHTPTPRATGYPTLNPTPPPYTSTPTPTPTPTYTAMLGVRLLISQYFFRPGDWFFLIAIVYNHTQTNYYDQPFATVLDVFGEYFFYPSWTYEFECVIIDAIIGEKEIELLNFIWPYGCGSVNGIYFHSAMLNHDQNEVFGDLGSIEFGWSERPRR